MLHGSVNHARAAVRLDGEGRAGASDVFVSDRATACSHWKKQISLSRYICKGSLLHANLVFEMYLKSPVIGGEVSFLT